MVKRLPDTCPQTSLAIAKAIGYSPQPDGRALLLKTLITSNIECGEIELVPTRSFSPIDQCPWCCKVVWILLEEMSNQHYRPATTLKTSSNNIPVRHSGITVFHIMALIPETTKVAKNLDRSWSLEENLLPLFYYRNITIKWLLMAYCYAHVSWPNSDQRSFLLYSN